MAGVSIYNAHHNVVDQIWILPDIYYIESEISFNVNLLRALGEIYQ